MKTTKKIPIETDVIADVVCDLCKTSCLRPLGVDQPNFAYGVLKFHAGYGSDYDGTGFTLEVCDHCCMRLYKESGRTDAAQDDFWDCARNG